MDSPEFDDRYEGTATCRDCGTTVPLHVEKGTGRYLIVGECACPGGEPASSCGHPKNCGCPPLTMPGYKPPRAPRKKR